jgi:hypothetical protein
LTLSITGTWSSRLLTEEEPKSGTSINNPRPSGLDITTNHGISRVLEEQETCKSGAPTLDGSKFSNSEMKGSSIQPTIKFLKFYPQKMKKVKLLS